MKLRYITTGIVGVGILGLAATLTGLGIDNIDKGREIDEKRSELSIKEGIYPPPESSRLSTPSSPAYPSPGYEN